MSSVLCGSNAALQFVQGVSPCKKKKGFLGALSEICPEMLTMLAAPVSDGLTRVSVHPHTRNDKPPAFHCTMANVPFLVRERKLLLRRMALDLWVLLEHCVQGCVSFHVCHNFHSCEVQYIMVFDI